MVDFNSFLKHDHKGAENHLTALQSHITERRFKIIVQPLILLPKC